MEYRCMVNGSLSQLTRPGLRYMRGGLILTEAVHASYACMAGC
jgi:hypothetical protein